MRLENEIRVERYGDVIILDIRGDITSYSETALKASYHKHVEQQDRKIILKIERDAYINSGGIALLIQVLYLIRENRQIAAIVGASRHYKKIFNMVGITKFAKICDTLEIALDTSDSKPGPNP